MRRAVLLMMTVVLGAVVGMPLYGDEPPVPVVVLEMRATVDTPEEMAIYDTTYIYSLRQDDAATLDVEGYSIDLLVTDERDGEFSVELTLRDKIGTVMDSDTVLIGADLARKFTLESDEFTVVGDAKIENVLVESVAQ